MTMHTARIELHHSTSYESLHTAMGLEGYSRTIKGSDGVTYDLPPGMYVLNAEVTLADAFNRANRAASRTQNGAAVFVHGPSGAQWMNLPRAQRAA